MIYRVKTGRENPADPLNIDYEEYLDLDEIPRTFNHACSPNAFIRGKNELVTLCPIKVGEEITFDYSSTMVENVEKINQAGIGVWSSTCHCGSPQCRGKIDQFQTLPNHIQQFYVQNGFLPDFVLRKLA